MLIIRVTTVIFKVGYCFLGGFINQVILKAFLRSSDKYKKYEEERQLQEKIDETEKKRIENEKLNKKHDDIAYALSSKLEEMTERFPSADKRFFTKYKMNFTKVPMDELEQIEKDIELSHYENTKKKERELGIKPKKIYDEISLSKIPVLHSQTRCIDGYDVNLNVHKDEDTYIVFVNVPNLKMSRIFSTFDLTIAKRVQNSIATRCGLAALNNYRIENVLSNNVLDEIIAGAIQNK
jgi:hypothetical protein